MIETQSRMVCDVCNFYSEDFDLAIFTRAMFRAALRELGWVRRRSWRVTLSSDQCPRCSGKKPRVQL